MTVGMPGSAVRRWLPVLLVAGLVGACSASTMSRSDNLASVWPDPWKSHGRVLNVLVYPYDVDDHSYLVCHRPCPEPPSGNMGNTWIDPLDPSAFRGWRGTRAARVRVRINAAEWAPDAVSAHYPVILEEVATVPLVIPDAAKR